MIRKRDKVNTKDFFISFIILNVIFFFIFLLIPDLGTVMILAIVGLIMCRYAGAKIKYVIWILLQKHTFYAAVISGVVTQIFSNN